jgi:hypothetical protein
MRIVRNHAGESGQRTTGEATTAEDPMAFMEGDVDGFLTT